MSQPSRTDSDAPASTRRDALVALSAIGIGTAAFQRSVAQQAADTAEVSAEMIHNAEWVAGIELTEEQRLEAERTVRGVMRHRKQLREVDTGYDVLPALRFDPEMFQTEEAAQQSGQPGAAKPVQPAAVSVPDIESGTTFLSIRELGKLLRSGKVTAVDLARNAIARLKQIDPTLHLVVTLTEDLAIQQAKRADRELAAGKDRGPLHGIPWGAKDLIAVAGYPTTWGAPQFREQQIEATATVAGKLEQAGAVLVAKLSLGALAMGDKWFGGMTRNPWNPDQGSSGSSAGSASAVAAGAVPFALGSETLGSIVSPSRRCGVTGLRPTFGRVSRHGCMSLSWTMDKLGPIARSVDDCGIVFDAIHGRDPLDPTSVTRSFQWPVEADFAKLKIGRVDDIQIGKADQKILDTLEELGANVVPVQLPREIPEWAVSMMLDAEAATIFHDLIASNDTEGLNSWPATFRKMHFLSAVDYLQAARVRSVLMQKMATVLRDVDLYVGGHDLGICNLTGHPTIALPAMMNDDEEHPQPVCGTLTGGLHQESVLLAVAAKLESVLKVNSEKPDI